PTGLGHPKQIMATLSSSQFNPYIELRSTLTLTDARYFGNDKYTTNANFKQQLEVADIIIANKSELVAKAQVATMHDWL
ncbi:GTP-binding protein, partial [Vibrio breoganii]